MWAKRRLLFANPHPPPLPSMTDENPLNGDSQSDHSGRDGSTTADVKLAVIGVDEQTQKRIQTACLVILAVLAATYLIYWLRPVLVPFVVALFVVSGLSPILAMLERTLSVTRIVAAGITFLAGVALLIIFGCTIWISVWDLAKHSQAYIDRVEDIAREIEERVPFDVKLRQKPSAAIEPASIDRERAPKTGDPASDGLVAARQGSAPVTNANEPVTNANEPVLTEKDPVSKSNEGSTQLIETIAREGIAIVSQSLVNLVSTSVVVLIFVFFLLLGTPSMVSSNPTVNDINHQVRSYLALKTIISVFTGLAFGFALRIFGVPMAFTFGVLAFLLNFVPNVGPIVASVLPIPLIIFDPSGNVLWMVAVITVTSMIQVISGNIVEPKIMGNASDLHPVVVLLSLMFWGMMWGAIGMFLATPIAAGFKIVLESFDGTKPLAAFMAGRTMSESKVET